MATMTHTDHSIIGFLRARIDELDQDARLQQAADLATSGTVDNPNDAAGWVAIVVEDCHAKRAILDYIELPPNRPSAEQPGLDDDAGWALQHVLRRMAEPWSGHSDYQASWRP